MKKLFIISLIAGVVGAVWFCWQHHFVVINFPDFNQKTGQVGQRKVIKKNCKISVYKPHGFYEEYQTILWPESIQAQVYALVASWVSLLQEEKILTTPITVQAVTLTAAREAFVSFDYSFLPQEWSCYHKSMLIESLLKTVREAGIDCPSMRFLLNFKPWQDQHLALEQSIAITGFLPAPTIQPPKVVVSSTSLILLDAAGGRHSAGRIVGDVYERGLAKQATMFLKKYLEMQFPALTVGTLRAAQLQKLDRINAINNLQPALFVHIMVYQETDELPHVNVLYYVNNPLTDFWHQPRTLEFLSVPNAYKQSLFKSYYFAQQLHKSLSLCPEVVVNSCGLPLAPLFGVAVPALVIEIGLSHKKQLPAVLELIGKKIALLVEPCL